MSIATTVSSFVLKKIISKLIEESAQKKLSKVFETAVYLPYNKSSKIVIMSDCHRGTNDLADNFHANRNIFKFAITRYFDRDFHYIELGDGDELWENKKQKIIFNEYSDIFLILNKFWENNRLTMVYGNHDIIKKNLKWIDKHYTKIYEEESNEYKEIFNNLVPIQSIVLKGPKDLYCTHGHQTELINSTFWKLGRFLVRYIWRFFETIGMKQPGRISNEEMNKCENRYIRWTNENNKTLICGHTHIPRFENNYFNTGSCVSTQDRINALEIEEGEIKLVEWYLDIDNASGYYRIDKKILKRSKLIN